MPSGGVFENTILTIGKDALMRPSLPALTSPTGVVSKTSVVWCSIRGAAVLPDAFFVGPAPRLVQKHHLRGIQLLPVRRLLFSSLGLIYSDLWNIPYCEYTSAEAMVTCLATVTRLKSLSLGCCFPRSGPASTYSPPPMHIFSLALTHFMFDMSLSPGVFCDPDRPSSGRDN